jgi:hypothetical protein
VAEYYEFFPLVCLMSNYEADEELSNTCVSMLAMMGQALTLPQHVPVVLHSVSKVSAMTQAFDCWLPIVVAQVQSRVRSCWIFDGQNGMGIFSLSTLVSPASSFSTYCCTHRGLIQ